MSTRAGKRNAVSLAQSPLTTRLHPVSATDTRSLYQFRATPRIGIRFDEEAWAFFDPDELYRTAGGNFRVKLETAISQGEDLLELAGESSQFRLDDLQTLA